jgi:hypothetical protein
LKVCVFLLTNKQWTNGNEFNFLECVHMALVIDMPSSSLVFKWSQQSSEYRSRPNENMKKRRVATLWQQFTTVTTVLRQSGGFTDT